MTTKPDIELILDTWFKDGPTAVPDRVLDSVADRIEHQSQRPAWRLHRRETTIVSFIPKPDAAIAAVLIVAVGLVAVVGLAPRSGQRVPGSSSTPTATPPTSAAPTIAPTTAPTKALASTPALPAPAELQGRWRAEIAPDVAILTFTATTFTISWLGGDSGRIEVDGDEITFRGSPNPECPPGGTYRWSIEGDKLHLEPVGTDPCPFQTDWAGNRTYTRYD